MPSTNQDFVPRAPMNSPRSLISTSSTLSLSSDFEFLTLASEITSTQDEQESFDWFDTFIDFIARRKRKLFIGLVHVSVSSFLIHASEKMIRIHELTRYHVKNERE